MRQKTIGSCPKCKSENIREFTVHEFRFEHPNNMVCGNCHNRWIKNF